jgi:hypothetical protein
VCFTCHQWVWNWSRGCLPPRYHTLPSISGRTRLPPEHPSIFRRPIVTSLKREHEWMKLRRAYIFRGHFPITASTNCQVEISPIYQTFWKIDKSRRVDRSQRPIIIQYFKSFKWSSLIQWIMANRGVCGPATLLEFLYFLFWYETSMNLDSRLLEPPNTLRFRR